MQRYRRCCQGKLPHRCSAVCHGAPKSFMLRDTMCLWAPVECTPELFSCLFCFCLLLFFYATHRRRENNAILSAVSAHIWSHLLAVVNTAVLQLFIIATCGGSGWVRGFRGADKQPLIGISMDYKTLGTTLGHQLRSFALRN